MSNQDMLSSPPTLHQSWDSVWMDSREFVLCFVPLMVMIYQGQLMEWGWHREISVLFQKVLVQIPDGLAPEFFTHSDGDGFST